MTQTQLFVATDINEIQTSPTSQPHPVPAETDREPLPILVIGEQLGIDKMVSALYLRRFAAVLEWSQILPAPTIGKLVRSLIRYVSLN
ncbi:peptide ABC transporter substrate-binding protein [Microcoleus sp. MON1_C5]|uniref:peptide ABC transporter substrate-binding protein n=1 Tax=Microcoleus sp. MON1_C5 TaxID=2818828 RepID=UPI002FD3A263